MAYLTLSTELDEVLLGPIDCDDLELGLESDLDDSFSWSIASASSLWVTTNLVLSMLVTLALRSTMALTWSNRTDMSDKFHPYCDRIGPNTSSTNLVCLALTPILFLEGSSKRKRTLGSTRTSLHPKVEQSSERSSGLSLPVMKASNDVNLRPRLSRSRETKDLKHK